MHPRRFVLADPGAAIPRFLAEVFGKEDNDILPPKDIIRGQNQKEEDSEDKAHRREQKDRNYGEDLRSACTTDVPLGECLLYHIH